MKKEIAEKWIAELRSGKYAQGKTYLESGGKFCCLGILCKMGVDAGVCESDSISNKRKTFFVRKNLPERLAKF